MEPSQRKTLTWDVERVIFFLQERVTTELDHLIGNAVRTQEVSDSLRDQNNDLTRGLALQ